MLVKDMYNLCLCQCMFYLKEIHVITFQTRKNKVHMSKVCQVMAGSSKPIRLIREVLKNSVIAM